MEFHAKEGPAPPGTSSDKGIEKTNDLFLVESTKSRGKKCLDSVFMIKDCLA